MNTIDVYRATVTVAGRTIFAWESFWPVPTRTDVLAPGQVRRVIGGNYPIVVSLPEGARLASEAKPFHRLTPSERGIVSEEIGERRIVLFGDLTLGADAVYSRAMAGLDGFAIVSGVEGQDRAVADPTPATKEIPVYAATFEVRDTVLGKVVNRKTEYAWAPIAPAEWVDHSRGGRCRQEAALDPVIFVTVPATAELIDRLGYGVLTLRLAPDDPPPFLDPADLVRMAIGGEGGLTFRRVEPAPDPAPAPVPEPEPASPPPAPAPTPQPRRVARRSKASAGQLSFNW